VPQKIGCTNVDVMISPLWKSRLGLEPGRACELAPFAWTTPAMPPETIRGSGRSAPAAGLTKPAVAAAVAMARADRPSLETRMAGR